MVLESPPEPLLTWLQTAVVYWVGVSLAFFVVLLLCFFVVSAVAHGPLAGGDRIFRFAGSYWQDLRSFSLRRALAMARLAVQEAVRSRLLWGFAFFLGVMLFATWFQTASGEEPARQFLDFMLTTTSVLLVAMALLLSAFSLPTDISRHTIYTVVTKPVRSLELVLGRVLGFSAVSLALLAVLGACTYVLVVRGLDHGHEISLAEVERLEHVGEREGNRPRTSAAPDGHRHVLIRNQRGEVALLPAKGHTHSVLVEEVPAERQAVRVDPATRREYVLSHGERFPVREDDAGRRYVQVASQRIPVEEGGQAEGGAGTSGWVSLPARKRYHVGPPRDHLTARVPVYGKLSFRDRGGARKDQGINVGYEWTYRSYIEGGTLARAIWSFRGLRAEDFPDGLPLHMTIRVFRTHKGEIREGVAASIVLRNPRTKRASSPINFVPAEYVDFERFIPRKLVSSDRLPIDLFEDLVADGELDIELRCLEAGQFFGMAQPDMYLLAREASFELNLLKGLGCIWMQVLLVISAGVLWSTFLNGAVAMLANLGWATLAFFRAFLLELARGTLIGGGPTESAIKVMRQDALMAELEPGVATTIVTGFDRVVEKVLHGVALLLPDLRSLSVTDYVSFGFNVPLADVLLHNVILTLAYLIPMTMLASVFFKMREVAS
jgi:hypothetical protein